MDRILFDTRYYKTLWSLIGTAILLVLWAATVQTGDYTVFLKNNKKGLRNHKNKVLIPAQYEDLGWSNGGFLPLEGVLGYKENGLWGLINLKNQRIISPHYTYLDPLSADLIIIAKHHHVHNRSYYGIINLKGNSVVSADYHHLAKFGNLLIAARDQSGSTKYGLLDLEYQKVIHYIYDSIKPINDQFAIVQAQGKLGLINNLGQVVVAPYYQDIELQGSELKGKPFDYYELKTSDNKHVALHQANHLKAIDQNLYLSVSAHASSLINTRGSEVRSFANSEIGTFENGLAVIRQGTKYGVVDTRGKLVIPLEYDSIWLQDNYLGIRKGNNKWMMLNTQYVRVTQKDYQDIMPSNEGLFPIKRHGNWGFINNRGVEVVPPQYQAVQSFSEGVAMAQYGGSWGLIDRKGNWLVKPRYTSLKRINNETYLFHNGSYQGLVALKSGVVYKTSNQLFSTPMAVIEQNIDNYKGLISLTGEQLLSVRYHSLNFQDNTPHFFHYQDSVGTGLFNAANRTFITDPAYQEIRTINEDFIGVKINNQYGFIDQNGKLRIANRYDNIGVFKETMSPVKIKSRWGYIDRLERLKIQPIYDFAGPFENGLAIVAQKGKYGLVDIRGKVVLPLNYDDLKRSSDGRFICYQGSYQGLIDELGKLILHPKYHEFTDLGNGYVIVGRDNKYSLVSDQGVSMIPMIYDDIEYDALNDLYIARKQQPWETIKL